MNQFERRIYLGILFIIVAFVPIILGSFWSLQKLVNAQKELITNNAEQMFLSQQLRYINSIQSSLMPIYVLTGHADLIKDFDKRYLDFERLSTELLNSEKDADDRDLIIDLQNNSRKLHVLAGPGILMRQQGQSAEKVNEYFRTNTGPLTEHLHAQLRDLVHRESSDMEKAKEHIATTIRWIIGSLLFLLGGAIALVVVVGRLIVKVVRQKRDYEEAQLGILEKEKRMSNARKEVVEVVSHDLKNPLGTIQMTLYLMIDDLEAGASKEELIESLKMAQRSAASMQHLIEDLLDHSKIESGKIILDRKDYDLGKLTKDLLQRFEVHAKNKNISLQAQIEDQTLMAKCDLGRIEQVISNLLGNALKFTPAQGSIFVKVKSEGDQILIQVKDSGVGIAKDQLPHIFDRFWQVRETAKNGNGLGLAIAKFVVEAHQGKIWVESEPGQGSKFCLSIPKSAHALDFQFQPMPQDLLADL